MVYLLEGLLRRNIDTQLICPSGSALQQYCRDKKLPHLARTFHNELDFLAGKVADRLAGNDDNSILHLHSGHAVSWGLWARLFNRRIRLVATRRVDFSIRKNMLSGLKYRTNMLDHIVCISEHIRGVLIQDGIPLHRLSVIPSGIDLHKFDQVKAPDNFRQSLGISDHAILVGTIAALTGHKDYPNLIKAAALVCQSRPDIWFAAVGEGELLEGLKRMAAQLNVSDRFLFCGFQKDVGCFLKSFDIFVLASKMEGLGTSLMDAMSVGLPIVATRAGGIPEIITDLDSGWLVPIKNPSGLAQAILKLAGDPQLRNRLGRQALHAVSRFDINNTVDAYIELYRDLLHESL